MTYTTSVKGLNNHVENADYTLQVSLVSSADEKRQAGCKTKINIQFEKGLMTYSAEPVPRQPVQFTWDKKDFIVSGAPDEGDSLDVAFFLKAKQGVAGQDTIIVNTQVINQKGKVIVDKTAKRKIKIVQANGYGNKPDKPTNVSAVAFGAGWIICKWNAHPSTEWTEIQYKRKGTNTWINVGIDVNDGELGVAGTDDLEYEISGLTANTEYNIRMRSRSPEFGNSGWSNEKNIKTTGIPPFIWASGVRPVFTALSSSSVQIDWTLDLFGLIGSEQTMGHFKYTVYWSTDNSLPIEDWSSQYMGVDIDSYTLNGLEANTVYFIRIKTEIYGAEYIAQFDPPSVKTKQADGGTSTVAGFYIDSYTTKTMNLKWDNYNISDGLLLLSMSVGTGNPAYEQIATLSKNAVSYVVTGLQPSTVYNFQLSAKVGSLISDPSTVSGTTASAPAVPNEPTDVYVEPLNSNMIQVFWTPPASGTVVDGYVIYRQKGADPFDVTGKILKPATSYIDTNLDESTEYTYAVRAFNDGGESNESNTASGTTFARSTTFSPQCPFTLDGRSTNSIIEVNTGTIITSDLDRWVVRTNNGYWFRAGLKPQLMGGVLATASGGSIPVDENVEYTAYVCLFRSYDQVRSLPSPVSNSVAITTEGQQRFTFSPQMIGDLVACRDFGFDMYGNQVYGCDMWELYLASNSYNNAYLIGQYPVNAEEWENAPNTNTLDIPVNLDINSIFGGKGRPMELLSECSLPPACSRAYVQDNRVITFGDTTITPTEAERINGANVVMTNGAKTLTTNGWAINDALIYHRLFINGKNTGWEVWDVEGNTVYIRHYNPEVNEGGYNGDSGTFADFEFAGTPHRVYYSAYYSGEAGGAVTFSPQTFPPLTHFDTEFFPNDNSTPKAIIGSKDNLLVAKDSKWILVSGGSEPDFPIISTTKLSDGSGVSAPNSLTLNNEDNCFYVGDSGAYVVNSSGVSKISINSGNKHIFENVFDMASIREAVGSWFSREDWYIVANINRVGETGRTSGFIYDATKQAIFPFKTPYQITFMKQFLGNSGDYQVMFGTTGGRIGYFLKKGMYIDGVDYTEQVPELTANAINGYVRGGLTDTDQSMTMRFARPRIKMHPYDVVMPFSINAFNLDRIDDPRSSRRGVSISFDSSRKQDRFNFPGNRFQQTVVEFEYNTSVDQPQAYFEMRDLQVGAISRGASA